MCVPKTRFGRKSAPKFLPGVAFLNYYHSITVVYGGVCSGLYSNHGVETRPRSTVYRPHIAASTAVASHERQCERKLEPVHTSSGRGTVRICLPVLMIRANRYEASRTPHTLTATLRRSGRVAPLAKDPDFLKKMMWSRPTGAQQSARSVTTSSGYGI